jgi:hypothetical protein
MFKRRRLKAQLNAALILLDKRDAEIKRMDINRQRQAETLRIREDKITGLKRELKKNNKQSKK